MNPLSFDFAADRNSSWLKYYNRRFVNWMLTPIALAILIGAELDLYWLCPVLVPVLVIPMTCVLGWVQVRWRLNTAVFWVEFHRAVFKHGETLPAGKVRMDWYASVQRWLERCGLAGPRQNWLVWSPKDRENLSGTYDAVERRATGRLHAYELQARDDGLSAELRDKGVEICDRLEELPAFAEMLFLWRYFGLILLGRCTELLLVVTFPLFLVTAAGHVRSSPSETDLQNPVAATRAINVKHCGQRANADSDTFGRI